VISAVTTAGNVTVGSWVSGVPGTGALNYSNVGGLFIGNNEGIDLQGMNLFATVSNVTNPHTNTIAIGVVVTG